MKSINTGISKKIITTVTLEKLASAVGSGTADVFSTPMMVALMENAAMNCINDYLEEGETSVGTEINVRHISASPLGMEVYAIATVIGSEGRKITFKIEAFDKSGKIGEATHSRFVLLSDIFEAKAKAKLNA